MAIQINQPQPNVTAQPLSVEPQPKTVDPKVAPKKPGAPDPKAEAQPGAVAKEVVKGEGATKLKGVAEVNAKDGVGVEGQRTRGVAEGVAPLPQTPPAAPPTADNRLQAALELFTGLSAQLGAPSGTPSLRFTAPNTTPPARATLPELTFGRASAHAIIQTKSLTDSGAIRFSPRLQEVVDKRFNLVTTPPQLQPSMTLTPTQQASLARIGATLVPFARGLVAHPRLDPRGAITARFNPRVTIDVDDEDFSVLPRNVRDLVNRTFQLDDFPLEPIGGGETAPPAADAVAPEPVAHNDTGQDPRLSDAVTTHAATADMQAALETIGPVTVPAPELARVEGSLRMEIGNFAGADIEQLIYMFMNEFASDATLDLKETLKEMKRINNEKQQMRAHISAVRKQETEMKATLRTEYDRRCALPAENADRIDPKVVDFENYCQSQKLHVVAGSLDTAGEEVVPGRAPEFAISPNTTRYPGAPETASTWNGYTITPEDKARAQQLGLDPGQLMALRRTWDSDPKLAAKFGEGFEEWLVRSPADGGVGLVLNPTTQQGRKVAEYLAAHDPTEVTASANRKYDLSGQETNALYTHFTQSVRQSERDAYGNDFDRWLSEAVKLVPGQGAANATRASAYLSLQEASSSKRAVCDRYGISTSDHDTLKQIWGALVEKPTNFEDFLTGNVGLVAGQASNNGSKLGAYFDQLAARVGPAATAPADPMDRVYNIPGSRRTITHAELLAQLTSVPSQFDAGGFSADERGIQSIIDGLLDGSGGLEGEMNEFLGGMARAMINEVNNGNQTVVNGWAEKIARFVRLAANHDGAGLAAMVRAEAGTLSQYHGNATALADALGQMGDAELRNVGAWAELSVAQMMKDADKAYSAGQDTRLEASWSRRGDGELDLFYNSGGHQNHPSRLPDADYKWLDKGKWGSLRDGLQRALEGGETMLRIEDFNARPPRPAPPPSLSEQEKNAIGAILSSRPRFSASTLFGALGRGGIFGGGMLFFQPTTTPSTPTTPARTTPEPLTDAQRSAITQLRTGPRTDIEQPSQVGGLREMSLDQLKAYREEWENKKESLSELGEETSLRLQMQQDRRSKFFSTLSNMMKKFSDTQGAIIANMK